MEKVSFHNFGTVFLTPVKLFKLRKAQNSHSLFDKHNSMVFTSHSVPFPATCDLRSWLEIAPRERQKPFYFLHTSDGKQIHCTHCDVMNIKPTEMGQHWDARLGKINIQLYPLNEE